MWDMSLVHHTLDRKRSIAWGLGDKNCPSHSSIMEWLHAGPLCSLQDTRPEGHRRTGQGTLGCSATLEMEHLLSTHSWDMSGSVIGTLVPPAQNYLKLQLPEFSS